MSSRGYPKRSARAAGINTYSSSRRPRRSAAAERGVVVSTENLGVPAVTWTKVFRYPSAPLDEPYFGRSPTASFKVPIWVRVDELTEEEKAKYDEVENKRVEQRAFWKKQMEKRRDEADNEAAQSKEEEQTKVETDGGSSQEAPTKGNSDTSAMQVESEFAEPETVNESAGGQNQNETTQQTIVDGSSTGEADTLAQTTASPTITTEGGDAKH